MITKLAESFLLALIFSIAAGLLAFVLYMIGCLIMLAFTTVATIKLLFGILVFGSIWFFAYQLID